jgi:hypothetical protein
MAVPNTSGSSIPSTSAIRHFLYPLNLSKTTRRFTATSNESHGGDTSIRDDDARGELVPSGFLTMNLVLE